MITFIILYFVLSAIYLACQSLVEKVTDKITKTTKYERTRQELQRQTERNRKEAEKREIEFQREQKELQKEIERLAEELKTEEDRAKERKQKNIERKNSYFTNTSKDETCTQITIETWEKKKEAIDELIGTGDNEQINFFDNTNKLTVTEKQISDKMLEIRCRKAINIINNSYSCFKDETIQLIEEMLKLREKLESKQTATYGCAPSFGLGMLNRDLYRALRMIEENGDILEAKWHLSRRIDTHRERVNRHN